MLNTMQPQLAIRSSRLYLRPVQDEDWWDLYRCISEPGAIKYEKPLTDEQRRKWVNRSISSKAYWVVCLAETNSVIGNIYLGEGEQDNWELGYMLESKYQHHGYATEALTALIGWAFEATGAHRIFAFCNAENTVSWQLLDRLGFRREGNIKQNIYYHQSHDGTPLWQDTLIYAVLRNEWLALNQPGK